jgi:exopolysaccharide biosynthesis WecB/TagA/CpsF family protein
MLKRFAANTAVAYDAAFDAAFDRQADPALDTGAPRLGTMRRTRLFGLDLIAAARGDVAHDIVTMARRHERATIQFINAHCVNTVKADRTYAAALSRADYLLPDGSGLSLAARLAGQTLGDNLNGTDLFPELCREAAAQGVSIYLLGGKPGIAAAAAADMVARYPDLIVAGTRDGYWSAFDERAVIAGINAARPGIVLVGMGVPIQEKWIDRVRDELTAPVAMGVGGLFDYYSGAIARAPQVFRAAGCEWVWRLMQEPRRLFVRYVVGNPLFIAHSLINAWDQRGHAARLSLGIKHAFDRVAATAALMLFSVVFAAVALAIRLEDGGPVFFRQTRIGANGRPFRMWKFRSMVVDAELRLQALTQQSEREGNFKMKRDPRVTRVGAVLRRLSLDELPQLINIAAGDMSVVGPRPALPREVLAYAPKQRARLEGRPGLTCTWQVSGRADIPFDRQVELDVAYLAKRSMLTDLILIAKTVPAVLAARGAY